MEFEEQRRLRREAFELRVADARVHLHVVEELDTGDRDARLHRGDDRIDRAREIRELADRGRDRLGNAIQAQLDLGDDAERPLRADEQPREIVARARLAGAASGLDDPAVRRDDGEPQHVLAHRAVAHRVRARGTRRRHAANRRVRAGIDREE